MSSTDLNNVVAGRLYDYVIRMSTERKFKVVNYYNHFSEERCIKMGIMVARIVHYLPNELESFVAPFLKRAFGDVTDYCATHKGSARNMDSFEIPSHICMEVKSDIRNGIIKPLMFELFDTMEEGSDGVSIRRLTSVEKKKYFSGLLDAALDAEVIAAPADLLLIEDNGRNQGSMAKKRRFNNDDKKEKDNKKTGIIGWVKSFL